MIAVTSPVEGGHGRTLRLLDPEAPTTFGYHKTFGFVSSQSVLGREEIRRRQGFKDAGTDPSQWVCKFRFQAGEPVALEGCEARALSDGVWQLAVGGSDFRLVRQDKLTPVVVPAEKASNDNAVSIAMALLLLLSLVGGGYMLSQMQEAEKAEDLAALEEQQKVVVVPKVKVEPPKPVEKKKEVVEVKKPVQKQNGALVRQKLGFLALLGKKDLSKAVGGMPSPAERKSPGAGAGGTQGSGGEMLTGLGKGLRKTTVGNTGTAGLGGIGNAGAGGGEGGFGTSMVGSGGPGGGRVLGDVKLSDEIVLEGGLDKAVVLATIAKYLSQIRACYERGLRKSPGLTGQVNMAFEVNADGRLNFAKVQKTTLENPEVETCISRVMLSWQFPKPVGGTLVNTSYPFMLKPTSYM